MIKAKDIYKKRPSDLFDFSLKEMNMHGWVREYKFHPTRKWKIDHAHLETKVAVEIEGGTWKKSRHTSGIGFRNDCEKYNYAVMLGWRLFRFTTDMVESGYAINFTQGIMKK